MQENNNARKDSDSDDYSPNHKSEVLQKKIKFLEEELIRKDKIIASLKEDNELLLKTAIKNSQRAVDEKKFMSDR